METKSKLIFQVRVRCDGKIILPKEPRERNQIRQGTRFTIHDLGGDVMVMSRVCSRLPGIADQLANEWREADMSLESMLDDLRQVRKKRHSSRR